MKYLRVHDIDGNEYGIALVSEGAGYAFAISDLGGPTGQFGYKQMDNLSAAQALDIPDGATQATIICEGAPARYRTDGIAPTPTLGMPMVDGTVLVLNGAELPGFRVIEQEPGAILNVNFEG